jgi:hypothetical protein
MNPFFKTSTAFFRDAEKALTLLIFSSERVDSEDTNCPGIISRKAGPPTILALFTDRDVRFAADAPVEDR